MPVLPTPLTPQNSFTIAQFAGLFPFPDAASPIERQGPGLVHSKSTALLEITPGDNVPSERCGQRTRRKSMSARPGQAGAVYKYRGNWIGQWLEDVPGKEI